jgi:hypothetical protein
MFHAVRAAGGTPAGAGMCQEVESVPVHTLSVVSIFLCVFKVSKVPLVYPR